MFRSRNPPMPRPARPSEASDDANYLSAQVQQLLAMVLPQPVVTVLAAISDALYQVVLGKPNVPATYTSTLVPPALLLLVTYLAILLVYKSIRSFVGLLIFSLKWMVILGVLGVLLAWHFGNGDVQQGAQNLAQQSGMGASSWLDVFGKYSAAQQIAPFLSYLPQSFGMASGAMPAAQEASKWFSQYNEAQAGQGKRNDHVREYRDLRPSRHAYGEDELATSSGVGSSGRQAQGMSVGSQRKERKDAKAVEEEKDYLARFSRWMGADMGASRSPKGRMS